MTEDEMEDTSTFGSSRIDGYLYKLEQRPFVGQMRRKYWFVLPRDTPVLYWYKSPTDFNCAGRILLTGAAFLYNPREQGIFEIHVDNKCYLLEAPNSRARLDWLSAMQQSRRRHYRREKEDTKEKSSEREGEGADRPNANENDDGDQIQGNLPSTSAAESVPDEESEDSARSVFYLREDGELHPGSLEVPPAIYTVCDAVELKIDTLLTRGVEETQQFEVATKKLLHKARSSFSNSFPSHQQPRENCARCQELTESLEQLRNRCYELTDDLVVHQQLVKCLKRGVVAAHNQRDALKRCCVDSSTDAEKVEFILERESALAKAQFAISELSRDNETLKEENRRLEAENSSLNITVDAYQESVRTKDELIMNMVTNATNALPFPSSSVPSTSAATGAIATTTPVGTSGTPPPLATLRKSLIGSFIGKGTSSPAAQTTPTAPPVGDKQSPANGNGGAEATEALLVDFGTPTDVAAKNLFTETAVNDLNEMKDLVDGYRNQNKFLNNEVLELQQIVQSLEDRERKLIRQNFNIEAVYYQLKSRYIMLLNHFQPSMDRQKRLPVEPSMIQELIDEVTRPHSPMRTHNANSLAVETAKSSSTLATLVACPRKAVAIIDANTDGGGVPHHNDPETDSLGFYLSSPRTRKAIADFFAKAANSASGEEGDGSNEDERTTKAEERQEPDHREATEMPTDETVGPTDSAATVPTDATAVSGSPSTSPFVPSSSSAAFASLSSYENAGDALKQDDWLLRLAADHQKRSDDIFASIELSNNQNLVEWLQRWDAYLVNHVLQPMSPNPQLKMLVRCGIPNTYRARVWSSLVDFLVGSTKSETGKGYYDCLLRKAQRIQEQSAAGTAEEDAALKQIDLDLVRTLPNNKQFEAEQSPRVSSLKHILYAFRFHNRSVEYCQGLNRLGAIGLLYLDEPQAFWFLVACVDHLQPPNYYSPSLLGAVVDQRVLLDLVQDKMPALHSHLHKLEVDLSLFTLSWFLTIFVDVLSHNIYIKIFDVFLLEGNKVLFRFALALLKMAEHRLLECASLSGIQSCLSSLSTLITDFKTLAHIAFNCLNPFPARSIENRRQFYYSLYKNGKLKC
ncbi:hypothetical protein niasHS_006519 [Heterodera schachtii]|uniref:TBC1 domain family member 2B n=1 Tax=Heterodera schachtii TaxID=97005 RepID=A0ABD2JHS0_HETSC